MPSRESKRAVAALIFDLDGTLVDSLPGIEASLRAAARVCLPGRELPELRSVIGPPVAIMIERLWPDLAAPARSALVAEFRRHYDNEGCLEARLYDGVAETLKLLRAHELQLFVLTNKPIRPTEKLLNFLEIESYFAAVISPDSSDPPFSAKSAGAAALQRDFQLSPDHTLLVGDGQDDAAAASACGFRFIAAAYGYGDASQSDGCARLESFSAIADFVL